MSGCRNDRDAVLANHTLGRHAAGGGNAKTSDVSGVDSAQRDANVKPITAED